MLDSNSFSQNRLAAIAAFSFALIPPSLGKSPFTFTELGLCYQSSDSEFGLSSSSDADGSIPISGQEKKDES